MLMLFLFYYTNPCASIFYILALLLFFLEYCAQNTCKIHSHLYWQSSASDKKGSYQTKRTVTDQTWSDLDRFVGGFG